MPQGVSWASPVPAAPVTSDCPGSLQVPVAGRAGRAHGLRQPGVQPGQCAGQLVQRFLHLTQRAAQRAFARSAHVTSLFDAIHHVAIIASDYARSRHFYHQVLGLPIIAETLRGRQSWKLDLALPDGSQLELFSFPAPPPRPSYRRRAACATWPVAELDRVIAHLQDHGVEVEPVRVDELTGKRFTFFADPDGLPLELYEASC